MQPIRGWKGIAQYFRRGVRTVQRWEQLGLPIRRMLGKDRAVVSAYAWELDAWEQRYTVRSENDAGQLRAKVRRLQAEVRRLKGRLAIR